MLEAVYIFLEDDFEDPIYADPEPSELEADLWQALCEAIHEAVDGEGDYEGTVVVEEWRVGWKLVGKIGTAFACVVTDDVSAQDVQGYLTALARHYADEVDDPTEPERDGVADIVVDVIPPWEE